VCELVKKPLKHVARQHPVELSSRISSQGAIILRSVLDVMERLTMLCTHVRVSTG